MRWDGNKAVGLDGSPVNARRACEGSLKRLGVDSIDLTWALNYHREFAMLPCAWQSLLSKRHSIGPIQGMIRASRSRANKSKKLSSVA